MLTGITVDAASDAEAIARVAKALAHPARVRIIRFLLSRPGCIGGDIVHEVGLAQSTVSEHLRILKASGLVVGAIERPRICYSLDPAVLAPLRVLIGLIEARDEPAGAPCCDPALGRMPDQTPR
ncbi:ArsR/SmtB family transcription factor [Rhodobaculum claviforme]|uniref:Transcriptional regulator n=1 Tax=Rhodobaculum claviforme TaxID=1549854 RepID=A0A934WIF0_9RHOB|nr:metalloregulator ArsR/SmtB family transcription factor [Rhodobaculum claviforme]MBK5926488.1 transcriptional regulator [Rhodobaculum claviforme]